METFLPLVKHNTALTKRLWCSSELQSAILIIKTVTKLLQNSDRNLSFFKIQGLNINQCLLFS